MPLPTGVPAKKVTSGKKVPSIQPGNLKSNTTTIVNKPSLHKPSQSTIQQPIKRNVNALLAAADETDSEDDSSPAVKPPVKAQKTNDNNKNNKNTKKPQQHQQPQKKQIQPQTKQQSLNNSDSDSDDDDSDDDESSGDEMVQLAPVTDNKCKIHTNQAKKPHSTDTQSSSTKPNTTSTDSQKTPNNATTTNKKPLQNSNKNKEANNGKASLDDLFSNIKTNKTSSKSQNKDKTDKSTIKSDNLHDNDDEETPKNHGDDDMNWLGGNSDGRKRTEEGFLVYTYDELKFEEGGDTELCPFDCDCCFA